MCERVCFADIPLCIELAKHSGGDTDRRVPGSNLAAISGQIAERQKSREGKTARKKGGKKYGRYVAGERTAWLSGGETSYREQYVGWSAGEMTCLEPDQSTGCLSV